MSYILEALKKSEQERTRGATPTLHAVNAEPFREPRRAVGFYLLALALLTVVGVAGWLHPWQREKGSPIASAPAATAGLERPAPHAAPPARRMVAAMESTAMSNPVPIKSSVTKAAPAIKSPVPAVTAAAGAQTVNAPSSASPGPKGVARAAPDPDILDFSELPAAVQRALPKLAVSGYVNYTGDPSGRMVALGDQLVREGEEVRAGLKLEQIRPNDVVFSYKGYRFRVGAP